MKRNRRDHYIPRGYLQGFVDPTRRRVEKPLWYLDVPRGTWSEKSSREIGYRIGFYDYSGVEVEDAETIFIEFENKFPVLIRKLAPDKFAGWKEHLDFFLHYMQMMRARSLRFFEEQHERNKSLRGWIVEEVIDERTVKVRSLEAQPLPESFITNRALSEMCDEIRKGPAWLKEFNWALRYCESPLSPFVISEQPVVVIGPHQQLIDSVKDECSLLFFPLCWQACLIGSRQFFDVETSGFGEHDMQLMRKMYMDSAKFVVSPTKLATEGV